MINGDFVFAGQGCFEEVASEEAALYRTWVCRGNVIYVRNWRPAPKTVLSTYDPPPPYLTNGESDNPSTALDGDSSADR